MATSMIGEVWRMGLDATGGKQPENADIRRNGSGRNSEILLVGVFNTYYDKVFNFFTYHIPDMEQAQDLTGEVFLKVAAAWPQFDPACGAVSTWVFTIARNRLYDHWRKKRFIQVELPEISDDTDLTDRIEQEERKKALRKALSVLSEREREVLALKYGSELKNTEISSITGLSVANVGILLFRSLGKLKKEIKNDGWI